ncbi:hypothetical protein GCM10007377_13080 [Galliscardovia ingluviei]|uniref:DUF4244 domain-containing protein n=2 Tax=Galliscardovia ingluviei TaxID=1769422 RepID=A0A8J3EXC1_9BIFI|nr:hypothetical protein GCM10007377_13080 [Galliscardovia ingluviei]
MHPEPKDFPKVTLSKQIIERNIMNNHSPIMSKLQPESIKDRVHRAMCLLDARAKLVAREPEAGLATAEYAVVMIAATGFAGLLVAILKSSAVRTMLTNIVKTALSVA